MNGTKSTYCIVTAIPYNNYSTIISPAVFTVCLMILDILFLLERVLFHRLDRILYYYNLKGNIEFINIDFM